MATRYVAYTDQLSSNKALLGDGPQPLGLMFMFLRWAFRFEISLVEMLPLQNAPIQPCFGFGNNSRDNRSRRGPSPLNRILAERF